MNNSYSNANIQTNMNRGKFCAKNNMLILTHFLGYFVNDSSLLSLTNYLRKGVNLLGLH